MIFESPYWEPVTRIEMLQRWILVHSFLYYDLNGSVVSDEMFDNNCKQLYEMKVKYPKEFKRSSYGYAMEEFDGSTGFGYVEKLNLEQSKAVKRDAANLMDGVI